MDELAVGILQWLVVKYPITGIVAAILGSLVLMAQTLEVIGRVLKIHVLMEVPVLGALLKAMVALAPFKKKV